MQIAGLTSHAIGQTNVNNAVASGMSALTTSVQTAQSTANAAASTTATHTVQIGQINGRTNHWNAALTNPAAFATAAQGSKADSAWQNPASASYWTWTSDGAQITLTNYTGANNVVVPDLLDGLPVTALEGMAGLAITNISGGTHVATIGVGAFWYCGLLKSVTLPSIKSIGGAAFWLCDLRGSVGFPLAISIGAQAFAENSSLTAISIPSATNIGNYAFATCPALTAVYFAQNAPPERTGVYLDSPNVTNYVTNPTATGWTNYWNGRPVVRLPVYGSGANLTGMTAAQVGAVSNTPAGIAAAGGVTPTAATNIASAVVAAYAAPSFPVYDYGTRSNVVFVLSNNVLYIYGQ